MKRPACCLAAATLLLAACTDGTVLHCYKPLSADGWRQRDTVCFHLPKAEKAVDGVLTIGLRTTANPSMQRIVLAVEQRFDVPTAYRCDTVSYPLTDTEGNALTRGVNCLQYETQQLPIRLKQGQRGTIRIHHLMARETMTGITEIGIRIGER